MSFHSILVADHLNKIQSGKNALAFPEPTHSENKLYIFTDKAAIIMICMGFGLKKTCELCIEQSITNEK